MQLLNLGILAHVDAGKTSLTERLLYNAGVIERVGSVDDGNTQTDSLALEQQRGITIKAAVASFSIGDVAVNLIDTPGHPDFIAEVERVLDVLDGVVLVLSAVEGVQPQTRVLMRTLKRLKIPTILFINKIDRSGADPYRVLQEINSKLTPSIVPMGRTINPGHRDAMFVPFSPDDLDHATRMVDLLAERDDELLAAYLEDARSITHDDLVRSLARQTARAIAHPVYAGSAITGAGVEALESAITTLLPLASCDETGPPVGTVFKIERGPNGEKISYIRLFSGRIEIRDRLDFGQEITERATAIQVYEAGGLVRSQTLTAGRIGKLWGLNDAQIGDSVGPRRSERGQIHFSPPALETVVVPRDQDDLGAMHLALSHLAEQDPLINLRQDDVQQELYLSLYGEVQKEVIQETMATDYGIAIEYRDTTTICIERPVGVGEAVEYIKQDPNPFIATVGLRVEPGPIGSGPRYELAQEILGTMPHAFYTAIEETVSQTMKQGLHGWEVTDYVVTLTHTGYWPRQSARHQGFDKSSSSTGQDFRSLTPLVLMDALKRAGTMVYEPIHRFFLEIPADCFGSTLPALAEHRAVPQTPEVRGDWCSVEGDIPAAHVHQFRQLLPALSRGEGVLECAFDRYEPILSDIPARKRTDSNPLNRKEYLLRLSNRFQAG
jgi:ribosomal protection tetracycline resistance protein